MTQHRVYRLAVFASHPAQYACPLYRRIAQERDIELTVCFYSQQGVKEYTDPGFGRPVRWDTSLLEGFQHKFLPNLAGSGEVGGFLSAMNPSIVSEVRRGRYDAILLYGYSYFSDWLALFAAGWGGIPVFFSCDASLTYDTEVRRPWYIRQLKPRMLRWFYRRVHAFLVTASLNAQFYRHYGVPEKKMFPFPAVVDNQFFMERSAAYRERRDAMRAEMGLDRDDVVFISPAKMVPQKRPLELLEAYRRAADSSVRIGLLMVGDGELRRAAEEFCRRHKLRKVVFTGFANQSELPKYYAISDVLVRPDGIYKGPWGYTVNEAMACGLAVISTDKISATADLVRHEENGLVVRFADWDDLAAALARLGSEPELARQMGARSLEMIRKWSFEECVQGLRAALHSLPAKGTS